MSRPAHDAEVVDRQPRVLFRQIGEHPVAQCAALSVVGHDRVAVEDKVDVQLCADVALDVVEQLVRIQNVHPVVHLGMRAGEAAAGSVIVHHQVVDAEDAVVARDLRCDGMDKRFIRRGTEQRIDGIFCDRNARPEDEQRDEQADIAVKPQARRRRKHRAEQDCRCCDDVVPAVCRRRQQGGGADLFTECPVEACQPELHQNGRQQHKDRRCRTFHVRRV